MTDEDSPPSVDGTCTTFQGARQNSVIVEHGLRAGASLEDIIVALVNAHAFMATRVMEMQCITPYKIKMPDGRVGIWRCPEEMIPLKEMGEWKLKGTRAMNKPAEHEPS